MTGQPVVGLRLLFNAIRNNRLLSVGWIMQLELELISKITMALFTPFTRQCICCTYAYVHSISMKLRFVQNESILQINISLFLWMDNVSTYFTISLLIEYNFPNNFHSFSHTNHTCGLLSRYTPYGT